MPTIKLLFLMILSFQKTCNVLTKLKITISIFDKTRKYQCQKANYARILKLNITLGLKIT
jgi:hypothetical protein